MITRLLLASAFVLSLGHVAQAKELKKVTYRQETLATEDLEAGTMIVDLDREKFRFRGENLPGPNLDLTCAPREAGVLAVKDALGKADWSRVQATEKSQLGPFTLFVEFTDGTKLEAKGANNEYPGLNALKKALLALKPLPDEVDALRKRGALAWRLQGEGERGARWTLAVKIDLQSGDLTGSFDGAPGPRPKGDLKGSLTKAELDGIRADLATPGQKKNRAKAGRTFLYESKAEGVSVWVTGMLEDHPELMKLATRLSDVAGRVAQAQAPAKGDAEPVLGGATAELIGPAEGRARRDEGLAFPGVPAVIANSYTGPIAGRDANGETAGR